MYPRRRKEARVFGGMYREWEWRKRGGFEIREERMANFSGSVEESGVFPITSCVDLVLMYILPLLQELHFLGGEGETQCSSCSH